jgi:tRNA (cytidine/uridine-2'-O-)-methyltransferase
MEIAIYQPDIAPNVGTLIRLGACMGVPVNIIEPCGFPFGMKDMRRAVMDYAQIAEIRRHSSWEEFDKFRESSRLVLLTTRASVPYTEFLFRQSDILLLGRESAGVPDAVHDQVDGAVLIPMQQQARSVNVALSAAMVLGEALRQTDGFPSLTL